MFKYLPLIALGACPIYATNQSLDPLIVEASTTQITDPSATADAMPEQSLARSVELIIEDLEKATLWLDNPNAIAILENLQVIDDTAKGLLVELIALLKIGKLEDAGLTAEQLQLLAKKFNVFHTKFCTFKKSQADTPSSEIDIDLESSSVV